MQGDTKGDEMTDIELPALLNLTEEAALVVAMEQHASGRLEEAEAAYRSVLTAFPGSLAALQLFGVVSHQLGRSALAETCLREVLSVDADFVEAYSNLGIVLQAQGKIDEAIASYRQALERFPEFVDAHYNLGIALRAAADFPGAAASYRNVLQLSPGHEGAQNNLSNVLRELGDVDEAVSILKGLIQRKPDSAEAHNNLGIALAARGDVAAANTELLEALRLNPQYLEALQNLVWVRRQLCEWCDDDKPEASDLAPPLWPTTPESNLERARHWVTRRCAGLVGRQLGFTFSRRPRTRLRVGYFSSDFREHPVACLAAELFERHDRGLFDIYAYSHGLDDKGPMRRRLVAAFDHFVDVCALSFEDAARRIHDDEIDILVDLNGHTHGARTEILALRPAPIQVNYLGYPGTMGADFVDYIVTDRFVTPLAHQAYFDEKLVFMPDSFFVNDSTRPIARETPSRESCGLPRDGFVFCAFNSAFKITEAVFAIWMRLLAHVPSSVLWLRDCNETAKRNLAEHAERRGVSPRRLVYASRVPAPEHLARHRVADLFVDSFPYNAHTTASDALWSGLPVVTQAGDTFASRVAGSLLHALGMPELITYSAAEYESLALRLALNPTELSNLRDRLQVQRRSSALFDCTRFARNLEHAYRLMWDRYASGAAVDHVHV